MLNVCDWLLFLSWQCSVNLFHATGLFLYPLKTSAIFLTMFLRCFFTMFLKRGNYIMFHILKICMFVQCFLSYLQSSDCRHNVMNIPNCIIKSMKKLYLITKFSPVFIGICDCSWSTLLLWLTHWLPASNKASLRTKTQC